MIFYVECACGSAVRASLTNAGSTVTCGRCHKPVRVPSSTKLFNAQDDPLLTPLQLALWAIENKKPPFDGTCHDCRESPATKQRKLKSSFRIANHFVRPEDAQNEPRIVIANPEDSPGNWFGQTELPLKFCESCVKRFSRHKFGQAAGVAWDTILKATATIVLFAGLFLLSVKLGFIVAIVGALVARQKRAKPDAFLQKHLLKMPWVGDIVRSDNQLQLQVEPIQDLV